VRSCSRSGCARSAVATLTYVYSDSTAVVGPLASFAEPHSYDLCEEHAVRLTVPRGWEVMRHDGEYPSPIPHADDLEALADAVREAARAEPSPVDWPAGPDGNEIATTGRRGHLRVVPPAQ
jgi:Protein of unknown function (DUF3499)